MPENISKIAPSGSVRQFDEKKSKDDIISLVNERYDKSKNARQPFERQWFLNIAFKQGRQYVYYDTILNRLVEPEQPEWRVRIVINRIRPIINTAIAKLLKERPVLQVVPNTTDDDDISACEVGGAFLESSWRDLKIEEKLHELVEWMMSCGKSFLKVYWNPYGGEYVEQPRLMEVHEPIFDPMTGQPTIDPETGEPKTKTVFMDTGQVDAFWTGDIVVEVVPAFEIFNDPSATTLDSSAWVIHAKWRPLDWIRNQYAKGDKVAAESDSTGLDYSAMLLSGIRDKGASANTSTAQEGAVVKEYWEWPNKVHPKGRLVTVANGVLLQESEIPFTHDTTPPFVEFDDMIEPGQFWSTSRIQDLIPLQVEYNKTRSQALENKNLMQRPKWMVRNGSLIDQDMALTDEPGEVVLYTGERPEAWVPTAIPAYQEYIQQINSEFMELSGQHEVSNAQLPSGPLPGVAIQLLQEADDTKLGPVIRRFHRSLERVGHKILALAGEYYTEPRLVKTTGKNRQTDVKEFMGAELARNYDCRIETGNAVSTSLAGKRQFILDMYGQKLFGPYANKQEEQAAKKVLMYLEFGQYDQQFDDTILDEGNAKAENEALLDQAMPQVKPYDNDECHIEEHERRLKQGGWPQGPQGMMWVEMEPVTDQFGQQVIQPPQQMTFEQALQMHVDRHRAAMTQKIQAEQLAMMPPQIPGQPPAQEVTQ